MTQNSALSPQDSALTFRAFVLGSLCAAFFAWLTVFIENSSSEIELTASQIPVMPFILLFLVVLLLNPLCRLIRFIRPLSVAELLLVFTMGVVSAGISTFGLSAQLVPIAGSLYYGEWNTTQSEWNRYIEPFVNEQYFVAYPGIQAAAREHRAALDKRDGLKTACDKAVAVKIAEEALGGAATGTDVDTKTLRGNLNKAEDEWRKLAEAQHLPERLEVLKTYPELMRAQNTAVEEAKARLEGLSNKAFAKVELFRRGLPASAQACPGLLPLAGDDAASYFGRFKRLLSGKAALGKLETIEKTLAARPEGELVGGAAARTARELLHGAIEKMSPLENSAEVAQTKDGLARERDLVTSQKYETEREQERLSKTCRWAPPDQQAQLKNQINTLSRRQKGLECQLDELRVRLDANSRQGEIALKLGVVLNEMRTLEDRFTSADALTAGAVRAQIKTIKQSLPELDVSYRRYFIGDVPWADWFSPLWRWGILLVLTYIIFMAFNVLIFRQWAHNEKLIYPLVELPEILAGFKDRKPGWVPEVFRSGLFWLGAAVSGSILGWNMLCYSKLVPGLVNLDLDNSWKPYIEGTALRGLLPSAKSTIFFTMIGLSFLAPAKVSFSLWFFQVAYMAQLLLLVGLGYGENENSFPMDWLYTLNFGSAEGGGALLVFAAVVFYTCRKYLLCVFFPGSVRELALDEQKELRVSSFLFICCSLLLIGMLWLSMGANLYHTVFFYAVMLVVTIGLVRAVTEGGLLCFQTVFSPFHFIRSFFGFDQSWTSASLFSPLMFYYGIFFIDLKTFIAPAMANCLKVRDDLRLARGRFHLAIGSAIVLAVLVAVAASLMLSYGRGANAMNSWFYTGLTKGWLFPQIAGANSAPPAATLPQASWVGVGALSMGLLLFFRRSFFWLPHPLGLIMLVNPIMSCYWFSILLGWLAKALVGKYGNRETYVKTRALFIGLIAGELFMVILALYVSYSLNQNIPIDLNRN